MEVVSVRFLYNLVPTTVQRTSLSFRGVCCWCGWLGQKKGSHLCWLGFQEVVHHLHYSVQLTVLPAEKCSIRAIGCHHSRVNRALNMLPQETTKLPFPKVDRAYGVKQTRNKQKNPNPTHTTHKKKSRKTPPPLQLLAPTLFTYCCTQGIYI